VDSFHDGRQSEQISQQTNALAITSGTCPPARAQRVLTRVLDPNDRKLCRCGTYFWGYLAQAMCRHGMQREMWREVTRLWDDMARRGATTWWETFLGDNLDSLCHFWSCPTAYIILAEVLGVKPAKPGFAEILLQPRPDLVRRAQGSVPTPRGGVAVAWRNDPKGGVRMRLRSAADAPMKVEMPKEWRIVETNGRELNVPPCGSTEFRAIRRA
jgi:hypothetical protein